MTKKRNEKMKKIAILIDNMYEDSEFIYPYYRLLEADIVVDIVGEKKTLYTAKHGTSIKATHVVQDLNSSEYDGVYVPGGYAPDGLRTNPEMTAFVKSFYDTKKLVCAVCHGPSLLISAGILKGKKVTSFPSIKDDIENAGTFYTNKSVEQDENIITAQDPNALPEMMKLFLKLLQKH